MDMPENTDFLPPGKPVEVALYRTFSAFFLVLRTLRASWFSCIKRMPLNGSDALPSVATIRPLRIVVVDDHVFMRDLITGMLQRQDGSYEVLASVGSAAEAVEAVAEHVPDLLILDINLPDRSGVDAVPDIQRASPRTHVLLCTAFPTEDRIIDALRVGAKGFVEKTNTWDDFRAAVDRVGRGERYFSSRSTDVIPPKNGGATPVAGRSLRGPLSPREHEVIKLIALGSTSKEIAAKLFISPATVETHRTNVMSKLGVRNVAALVVYAVQNGFLEPSTA
jgi:DNA-binding NarL/FixJ family response regulator